MTTVHTTPAPLDVPPAERGSVTIADRVVAKIAAQAAREALFHGVPEGGDAPHAVVTVHKNNARVRVGVELDYPSDIGAQCGAVRRSVSERVNRLAGMRVPEVEVRVERLHSPHSRTTAGGGPR
ncbi:Asp23/Gls24 family envelope stress response protein [Streptomyces sp. NRRL F-5126]|uniref:Asp23/Gls24 family envelope stress response protein n=1 Tax=Streptomyces sp. NRRL F-5126 TaxID=1463857 RepID=UPI0005602B53|nr:Asp23/Gls24 family envelope stress response protein [Streptomyces sp. NRRL F-5126]